LATVNEPEHELVPYRVVYSERVRTELKALADRATDASHGRAVLDALKELDARLRICPHYGERHRDLAMAGQSEWDAAFPPLFVEYVIDEPNRAVYVVIPLKVLPHAGFH
jgi:hypothetical protein